MNLREFLNFANAGKTIAADSEEIAFSGYLTQEALKITAQINSGYHTPEEIQELFAELTGQPVNRTLGLIPPFHTDCGKNIHIGERVFINAGCTIQDQGGVWIGDGSLIVSRHLRCTNFRQQCTSEKFRETDISVQKRLNYQFF